MAFSHEVATQLSPRWSEAEPWVSGPPKALSPVRATQKGFLQFLTSRGLTRIFREREFLFKYLTQNSFKGLREARRIRQVICGRIRFVSANGCSVFFVLCVASLPLHSPISVARLHWLRPGAASSYPCLPWSAIPRRPPCPLWRRGLLPLIAAMH